MKPWDFQGSVSLNRAGRARSVDVCARRYEDGAFVGCVRAPSQRGATMHTVEVSPREARAVRELMGDTASALRSALAAQRSGRAIVGHTWDLVGHTWDLVGRVAPTSAGATVNGCRDCWDVVGFDLSGLLGGFQAQTRQVQGALGTAGQSITGGSAGTGALAGALGGLASGGGAEGAAAGAVRGFGEATGLRALSESLGGAIRGAWEAPADGPPRDAADYQRRRNRAIRELSIVADYASHAGITGAGALSQSNWAAGATYHWYNFGISLAEWEFLKDRRLINGAYVGVGAATSTPGERKGALSRFDPRSPFLRDDGVTIVTERAGITRDMLATPRTAAQIDAGYPYPWPASAPNATPNRALVDALTWAYANPQSVPGITAPTLVVAESLPGVAGSQVSTRVPASTAGATLGATELLARALASIALERGVSSQEVYGAAQLLSSALRSVDAIAGQRANDPRAREALRNAINASAPKLASALRVGLALVGP